MIRPSAIALLLVALVASLACAKLGRAEQSSTAVPSSAPASCAASDVQQVLATLVDAFNRGDDPARYFAPAGGGQQTGFQWYSASGRDRPNAAILQRDDLAPYFAARHSAGERWSQLKVQYAGEGQLYPRADFAFLITRSAPDLAELTPAESTQGQTQGKGALNCKERTVLVLTM